MSKTKWYSKAISIIFALALVVGFSVAPVAANGPTLTKTIKTADGVAVSATNPMSGIVDFQFDYSSSTGVLDADSLLMVVTGPGYAAPINMLFYFPAGVPDWDPASEQAMMEMGIVDKDGDGSIQDDCVLAAYALDDGTTGCSFTITFSLDTTKNWSADTDDLTDLPGISGAWDRPIHSSVWPNTCAGGPYYHITSTVWSGLPGPGGTKLLGTDLEQDDYLYNDPYVWPTLAKDVKSGKQIFALKGALANETCQVGEPPADCGPATWEFRPGQGLSGVGQPGSGADIIVQRVFFAGAWGVPTAQEILDGLSGVAAVEVCSIQVGEVHGYADNVPVYTGGDITLAENWECVDGLNGEKKWGEIERTELTAWTDTPCAQRPASAGDTEISRVIDLGGAATEDVLVQELVIANFLPGPVPAPAGDAKITWWLLENDELHECQHALEDLMKMFDNYDYAPGELGWGEGCGRYAEWAASPDPDFIPYDIIEDIYATCAASDTLFTMRECVDDIAGAGTTKTITHTDGLGDPLGEGYTNVNVEFSEVGTTGLAEPVIVVVLAEYDTNYNGENPVCVEYIKFKPTVVVVPEVCQVKAPQVRWAGEKIVLEKDWGPDAANALVGFFLEEGTIGNMIPVPGDEMFNPGPMYIISEDARTAFTMCDSYGVARAMFETEQQGEVDIKCVLYCGGPYAVDEGMSLDAIAQLVGGLEVCGNHGFLVYYLALEDVTVDEALSDLEGIEAGDDADVLVKVRGWFTSDALPGTSRGPVLGEDGITYVRPAGRYILPDDWAALAGSDEATSSMYSRPQYDLMNTPGDGVTSTDEWGPFDTGVRTTDPPDEAEYATIGPFNTLQPWNCTDALGDPTNMWIATDSVPADYMVAAAYTLPRDDTDPDLRNTVVPDTTIDWYDCPMPQALVTFEVNDDTMLIELDKGDSLGYGVDAAGNYMAPFYAMEVPTHWLIPVGGYRWDSWGLWTMATTDDGPYDFWADLGITPTDDDVLEVYCDNHGYAGVTIEGEDMAEPDCVTLDVIADFPVLACKYPAVDTEQRVCWGIELEHLNADFEVSDRTGVAPITISFYGLKGAGTGAPWTTGGTQPYVKAEWDFDGNGTIDATIEGATSEVTLATQTFEFTTANSYSPWLRVTDTNGLVDICEKPNYIILTGAAGYWSCDIDESGTVDITDFVLFATAYGSSPGDANWDARCDLDGTDGVDILDFVLFATCYVAHGA